MNVGASGTVARTTVSSQKRSENGRRGSEDSSSCRSGAVRANATAVPYRAMTLHGVRVGSTRTTSHASPVISSERMIAADGSICQRLSPCR